MFICNGGISDLEKQSLSELQKIKEELEKLRNEQRQSYERLT